VREFVQFVVSERHERPGQPVAVVHGRRVDNGPPAHRVEPEAALASGLARVRQAVEVCGMHPGRPQTPCTPGSTGFDGRLPGINELLGA
jgi:hypothetical protein